MRSIITNIFGTYTPVTYVDSSGISVIPDGLSGVDWTYIIGALGFFLILYCSLRIFASILKDF